MHAGKVVLRADHQKPEVRCGNRQEEYQLVKKCRDLQLNCTVNFPFTSAQCRTLNMPKTLK